MVHEDMQKEYRSYDDAINDVIAVNNLTRYIRSKLSNNVVGYFNICKCMIYYFFTRNLAWRDSAEVWSDVRKQLALRGNNGA